MTDNELIELLRKNGLNRMEAKALTIFKDGRPRTMLEIERDAGMRQPEVSLSMMAMRRRGWFALEMVQCPGKGRPYYIYSLARTFRQIITDLTNERSQELAGMMNDLNALRAVA